MQTIAINRNHAVPQNNTAIRVVSDEVLLTNIAKGDRGAMHVLYARHHLRIYRFILRMMRNPTTSEDIVSHVFLDVWHNAGQFQGRSKVSTWLMSIARFKALTVLRQRQHESIDQDVVQNIEDRAEGPEAALARNRTSAILRTCIEKLSPAHREIVDLVYYHEMSVEEAGQVIGIPQATVKTRMFYARKHLGALLKDAGVDHLAA